MIVDMTEAQRALLLRLSGNLALGLHDRYLLRCLLDGRVPEEPEWQPIDTVPTDGMAVELRTRYGTVTFAFANPEFRLTALECCTHWRRPPA